MSAAESYTDDELETAIVASFLQHPAIVASVADVTLRGASRRRLLEAAVASAPGADESTWPRAVADRCPDLLRPRDVESYRRHAAALLAPVTELVGVARKRAALRDAREHVGRADAHLREGGLDVLVARAELEAAVRVLDEGPARPTPKRLARPNVRALCLAQVGAYQRIPTCLEPLDSMLGGGLQTNRWVLIGGPPGVVKTGLTLFLGWQLARAGRAVVAYIAHDEKRSGIYSRLGQIEGVTRGQLEDGDEHEQRCAWETVGERLGRVPLFTAWDRHELDGNPAPPAVEAIVADAKLEAIERGLPLVVVVDSIQKARFSCVDVLPPGTSPREQTDAKVDTCKALLDRGTCVIATSELNRGGYTPGAEAGLGSFKESGGLEYGADVPLTMSRVREEAGFVVELKSEKNRQGDEGKFRLRRVGCAFEPVAMPTAEELADAKAARSRSQLERAEDAIEAAILAHPDTSTHEELWKLLSGHGGGAVWTKAKKNLIDAGRLTGGSGKPFRIAPRRADDFGGDLG